MNPPRSIMVDGVRIQVRLKKRVGEFSGGHGVGGEYHRMSSGKPLIIIDSWMPSRATKATLLHELLHHCMERGGSPLSKTEEERVLDCIDSWLFVALRENPELVAYLTAT
jgi:hypothetical protein